MIKTIKNSLKVFLRSIYLPAVFLVMIGILNYNLAFMFSQMPKMRLSLTMNTFFYDQRFSWIVIIVFLFLSFEFFYRSQSSDVYETLEAAPHGIVKMIAAKGAILLLLNFFITLNVFAYDLFWYLFSKVEFLPFLIQIIRCEILNYFFVGLIAISAGLFFALWMKRVGGYLCIAAFSFMILPISNQFLAMLSEGFIDFTYVKIPFLLSSPNLEWIQDALYGAPNEYSRWALALFWIFLFGVLIVLKIIRNKKGVLKIPTTLLVCMLTLFFLYGALDKGGAVRKTGDNEIQIYSVLSYTAKDQMYYSFVSGEDKDPDFQVTSYNLDLAIANQLNATARIQVNRTLPTYIFTLYHGYSVQSVKDSKGTDIPFDRYGDYIDISPVGTIQEIIVTYSGSNHLCYSNDQAVLLPGYFAYYPIAGHYKIYNQNGYQPSSDKTIKEFTVTLQSSMKLYTNLTDQNGVYKGASNSLTILGGLALETVANGIYQVYLPVEALPSTVDISGINAEIKKLCEKMGESQIVEIPANYKFFNGPSALSSPQTKIVAFRDHMISYAGFTSTSAAAAYFVSTINSKPEKAELVSAFVNYLSDSQRYLSNYKYNPEFSRRYRFLFDYSTLVRTKLALAFERADETKVIQEIYRYLKDDSSTLSLEDFLNEISDWSTEVAKYENSL